MLHHADYADHGRAQSTLAASCAPRAPPKGMLATRAVAEGSLTLTFSFEVLDEAILDFIVMRRSWSL